MTTVATCELRYVAEDWYISDAKYRVRSGGGRRQVAVMDLNLLNKLVFCILTPDFPLLLCDFAVLKR